MLLIVSFCIIGDPVLDRAEVNTRRGRLQALDTTLAHGSKEGLRPTAFALRPFERVLVGGTREAWWDV